MAPAFGRRVDPPPRRSAADGAWIPARLARYNRRIQSCRAHSRAVLLSLACALASACASPSNGGSENTLATCQNGQDDDGDAFVDCEDQDCQVLTICAGGGDAGPYPDVSIPPGCGNGFLEAGEACDEGEDNGMGDCRIDCTLRSCGDGVIDWDEQCDDGAMNSDLFPNRCRKDCTSPGCGDMVVDIGEVCDSGPANSDVLPDRCRNDCQPPGCGDGVIDSGELCDDGAANSDTAPDACRTTCTPPTCGDGVVDGLHTEGCDEGAANGGPSCSAACAPSTCGNGAVDGTETCDGGVAGSNCATFGFAGGLLSCASSCGFDTSQCTACGNGTLEGAEQCDGTNLDGYTCATVTGSPGTLACDPFCYFDTTDCMTCGNAMIDVGEDCDGTALGGMTCSGLGTGFTGGTLACGGSCDYDTSACTSAPCDPAGTWMISPAILYSCNYAMNMYQTSFTITAFNFIQGTSLVANGTPIGFGSMTGSPTTCPGGTFSVSTTAGGGCSATYTLSGTFSGPDSWTGMLVADYTGACGSVDPCTDTTWPIMATR